MADATPNALVVLCTAPNDTVARDLARRLVDERLAACVNIIGGVQSVYRWQGKTQVEEELQLIIKTTGALFDTLEAWLTTNHPYEVPEVIALPVTAISEGYDRWVVESVQAVR